jgi:hypothetical protein
VLSELAPTVKAESKLLGSLAEQAVQSSQSSEIRKFYQACEKHFAAENVLGQNEQIALHNCRKILMQSEVSEDRQLAQDIQALTNAIGRQEREHAGLISFQDVFAGFSNRQIQIIGSQIAMIELSKGCSIGCPNCGFNALIRKGPQLKLSPEFLEELIDRVGENLRSSLFLYYASDPLDWEGPTTSYVKLLEKLEAVAGIFPETTTAIPEGKEDLALELWKSPHRVRFSISEVNYKRLVNAGVIKGQSYAEIESNLGPPGNHRSHVIGGREQNYLFDVAPPNQPLKYATGKRFEQKSIQQSIGCRRGIILSPDGIFNIYSTHVTPLSPNGTIREQVFPDSDSIISARQDRDVHAPLSNIRVLKLQRAELSVGVLPITAPQAEEVLFRIVADYRSARQGLEYPDQNWANPIGGYKEPIVSEMLRLFGLRTSPQEGADALVRQFRRDGVSRRLSDETRLYEKIQELREDLHVSLKDYSAAIEEKLPTSKSLQKLTSRAQMVLEAMGYDIDSDSSASSYLPRKVHNHQRLCAHAGALLRVCESALLSWSQSRSDVSWFTWQEIEEVRYLQGEITLALEDIKEVGKLPNLARELLVELKLNEEQLRIEANDVDYFENFYENLSTIAHLFKSHQGLGRSVKLLLESDLELMRVPSIELLALRNLAEVPAPEVGPIRQMVNSLVIFGNALLLSPESAFISKVRDRPDSLSEQDFYDERQRLLSTVSRSDL